MRKISFFFCCGLFASLCSQTPTWQWVNKVCTFANNAMASDPSGNVYVAGRYYGAPLTIETYTLSEGVSGSENLFMCKYDSNGKILWARRVASAESEINIRELVCDKEGNVYIGGDYSDSLLQMGSLTYTSSGASAYHSYSAKFDTNGDLKWAKILDRTSNEISDIDVDPLGNLIVIGVYWDNPLVVESTTLPKTGYMNIFLIKYDFEGNLMWTKREESEQFGFAGEVAFDKAGNFCMRYNSNGDYLKKYDGLGNILWTKNIIDAQNILNRQLICDSQLNIYYTADDTLHKLNSSGTLLYKKKLGQGDNNSTTANTQLMDIGVDKQDNVYLCGSFSYESMTVDTHSLLNSYLFYHYGPQYGKNLFTLKLDSSGNSSWLKGASGSFDHLANALTIDPNANILIAGHTESATLNFDNKTMITSTQSNLFIAKLGSATFTGLKENKVTGSFDFYPNPATGNLNLNFGGATDCDFTITISDLLSQVVYKRLCHPEESNLVVPLDNIRTGIYFIELRSGSSKQVRKVVVEKI